jgi:hypothetical protein
MVDYETRTLYAMQISFVENPRSGVPRLSVSDTLYLVVDNGNEAPVFTSSAVAFVLENLPLGTVVFTVTTSDVFNPLDGVTYALIGGTYSQYFRLSTRGALSTTYIFDYENDDPLNGTLVVTVREACNTQWNCCSRWFVAASLCSASSLVPYCRPRMCRSCRPLSPCK